MLIEFNRFAPEKDIDLVLGRLNDEGVLAFRTRSNMNPVIVSTLKVDGLKKLNIEGVASVQRVVEVSTPFKLASRAFKKTDTVVKVDNLEIGGDKIHVMAGPCAVESREQLLKTAHTVKACGATFLRGGAFKPRTSPYSFQGLNEDGLKFLAEARTLTGLKIVTEVMDTRSVQLVAKYADVLQIGARNMQNFDLLKEVGRVSKPVLLKRGANATIEEFLAAAEYVLAGGNEDVILCERGVRGVNEFTRYTLDIAAVPVLKKLTHLPVVVDPSHATGHWNYVEPMAMASLAAGADGLIIEVHPEPEKALCDGAQSLTPKNFTVLMLRLAGLQNSVCRDLAVPDMHLQQLDIS
ncbi:phospho-2-dehydro-3-deoxyheptonate aldolase [Desulfofarcimen acetoxidans DSM 771]|uniref:Phospho-2-dehydro-3-deoxyheptonate aldolase n=1 Tax=Desulfofarcimen acetoxidans (strain ATCC 49208 / DSM 771 / KCTC 5769 / VKM B-1644 / 5575) TaxID=485916 RepID=C8W3C7_DESAS|nr:3-deoxy-7-phosphoheptulonate synthase [Desulfofarcimen acetoxidans]ACV61894.1 phospho-2-dehydro-3-deoxyheptonate aldolase [Desulfofarcimen acetoxidans DSM 771]